VEVLRVHINIWGVVWDGGSVFAQYEGHLNGKRYRELLEEHLTPQLENIVGRTWLMDNISIHKTKAVLGWFAEHHINVVFLPPRTPEFNCIEECWGWMKQRVIEAEPKNAVDLRAELDAAGDALPQDIINSFLLNAQQHVRDNAAQE
jgi:transposase